MYYLKPHETHPVLNDKNIILKDLYSNMISEIHSSGVIWIVKIMEYLKHFHNNFTTTYFIYNRLHQYIQSKVPIPYHEKGKHQA